MKTQRLVGTEGRRPWEDGGGDWSCAAIIQGTPRATTSWERQERIPLPGKKERGNMKTFNYACDSLSEIGNGWCLFLLIEF